MKSNMNVAELERKIKQSIYADGLLEVGLGAYLFLLGWLIQINTYLVVFSSLLVFLMKPLFERTKRQIIYPRVGYVQLKQKKDTDPRGIVLPAVLMIALIVFLLFFLPFTGDREFSWWFGYLFPMLTGLMMAVGPVWFARTYHLVRGYIYALIFVFSSFFFPLSNLAFGAKAVGWVWLLGGFLAMIWGGWTFFHFIRSNPPEENPHAEA